MDKSTQSTSEVTQERGPDAGDGANPLTEAFTVDAAKVRAHVDEVVRSSVEQTLNSLLDAEADRLCNAGRYEHSPDRQDTRAGSYKRKLATKAGEVNLQVPRLRKLPLETATIERYKRRESSLKRR